MLVIFLLISTFLGTPSLKSEDIVLILIFGLVSHINHCGIFSNSNIISVGTLAINDRSAIFENSKGLKTIILPSRVRLRNHHDFAF